MIKYLDVFRGLFITAWHSLVGTPDNYFWQNCQQRYCL